MELGVIINELNENVFIMDAYNYNVSIAVGPNAGDCAYYSRPELQPVADAKERVCTWKNVVNNKRRLVYDDTFVQPTPPLFIEPVLTSPDDYVHLSSLPKRTKLDEYYVRSTVPSIVRNTLLQRPHNVVVSDPLNALSGDGNDSSTRLMKTNLYGPDIRRPQQQEPASSVSNDTEPPPLPPPLPSSLIPPTPTVNVGNTTNPSTLPRDEFLNETRQGVSLNPVDDRPKNSQQPVGVSPRSELLESILKGVKLKPVNKKQSAPLQQGEGSIMSVAMAKRRAAINPLDILSKNIKIMEIVPSVNDRTESVDDDTNDDESFQDEDFRDNV